jgi:hypothetical protein
MKYGRLTHAAVKIGISSGIIDRIARTMGISFIMRTTKDGITISNVITIRGMTGYAIIFLKANRREL